MAKDTALTAKIKIGNLDRPITFRRMTETQGSDGFPAPTWSDLATDFAAIDYSSEGSEGSEGYQADRQISVTRVNFTTRSHSVTTTITVKDRISYGGNEYDIESITEPMGRGRFLKFQCKLRV